MVADRNLLFGILALHAGLVSRDQLIDAMSTWTSRKESALVDILRAATRANAAWRCADCLGASWRCATPWGLLTHGP